jgi:hypothetical protein
VAEPTAPEPTAPEPTASEPTTSGPTGTAPVETAPDAAAGQAVTSSTGGRGRGVAAAVAALAALVAVVAAVRLRRGSPLGSVRLFRRASPPPRSAAARALAGTVAARDRAVQLAATAGPVVEASIRRAAVDAAQQGRAAATAARTYTDETAARLARLAPLLATTGQAVWRAARAGTDSALQATDAATVAVGAALPRVAAGVGRAGRTGLHAVLTVGAAAEAVPEVIAETGERLEKGWRRVMGRLSLGLGFGVGYVLGARAGRARYEQIRQAAAGFMERPEVQQAVEQVRAAAPAPLQSSIDKLSGGGAGRHSANAGGSTDTVDIDALVVDEVDVVVTPPPPVTGTGGPRGTDAPLADPLIPPAKSDDGPTGRP